MIVKTKQTEGRVRAYWTRQWQQIDPHVEPQRYEAEADGRIALDVHQTVHDLAGNLLFDLMVQHVYTIENGLIQRMEIK